MRITTSAARFAALGFLALAATASAQNVPRTVLQITARDSAGQPIPSAEITLIRGLKDVVARGTTDGTGQGTFSVELTDSTDFQVAMRKIGYPPTYRFFSARPRDTTRVAVIVQPNRAAQLAPMMITAEHEPRWKSYHLDADDIEHSSWVLENGWDVVKRLRPDMLTSRGGCETGAREVWVNGKRIRLPLMPTGMVAAKARIGVPARARFSYVPVSVLSEIAPEHIQAINYHDCLDTSMAAVGSNDAIFVVLKPGVVYQQDVGSFVFEQATQAGGRP